LAPMPDAATSLLQAGVLLGSVLVSQAIATRLLARQEIPLVLRGRVALSKRLRPWLLVAAATMVSAGLVLALR
jgi:hypothetical protein